MAESFADWANSVNGKAIDVQAGYGAQCYGLIQNYFNNVLGYKDQLSTQTGPHPGYAIDVYDGATSIGLSPYVQKLPATATPQQGDVAFWNYGSALAPDSHTAVVNKDAGSNLSVYSQNSPQQYTTLQNLPKAGLAGYLRPIHPGSSNMTSTSESASYSTTPVSDAQSTSWISSIIQSVVGPQVSSFLTNIFLPATWIRVVSGVGGVVLIILGLLLIGKDYRTHEDSNG